jgi:glycosyltransferase involved in cell wall biosynthesis
MRSAARARRGIVFFSAQDYWYHNRGHSDLQLTRGLATYRPVLLVNSIGLRMPTSGTTTHPWRRVARKVASVARAVRRPEGELPNLVVMTPVFLPVYGRPFLRWVNATLVAAQVRAVLWWLGVSRPDVVVTIPTASDVARRLRKRSLTVNRADKFSAFREADQSLIGAMEMDLLSEADRAVYVSHVLMEEEQPLLRGTATFLGHGLDIEHFSPTKSMVMPADLVGVERPIVGYFGGLDDYLVDFDLIRETADAMIEGTVVLIGDANGDVSALANHPRVRWLGLRDYASIPAYGAAFDVAVMPWLDNEWIRHCNPIKAKEYLALGLPVVTTSYPEAEPYADVMAIANSREEFIAKVMEALSCGGRGTPDSRRSAVVGESWHAKSVELLRLIDGIGDQASPEPR